MIKVLLAEDEEIIRRVLAHTIDWLSLGCTIVGEAENGEKGLELVKELHPDIIITDICMPGMSGIELLEQGKKECMFESIILTGCSEFEYAKKAVSLGAVEYILKPIDEEKLIEAIKAAVERVRSQQEYQELKRTLSQIKPEASSLDLPFNTCHNYYVKKVLEEIQRNYNKHLSIEKIADELKVSPGYLSKQFKKETSLNFVTAVQRYRVQKAISMMETGRWKIYEVSEAVGYSDYKRFCYVFKKVTNLTPTEFISSIDKLR